MRVMLMTDAMGAGGAERQLSYLAIGLKRAGCEVRLMQFYNDEVFYARELAKAGIVTEVYPKGRLPWRRTWIIVREVKRWNPDMVVAYKDGTSMVACLARLFVRFRLVVSERNTTQTVTNRERMKFFLYRRATWIVPNSVSQEQFIFRYYPQLMPKVRVITNMIDVERFHPASKEKILTEPPTIITTARIAPQKNVFGYLRTLRLLRDRGVQARFLWYGSEICYEDYFAQVIALQHELGLDDGYITFCGSCKEIAEAYRRADYFCLPSSYEGFANVLCEAMASGLVCAASAVCDNPDILSRPNRLFDPANPEDMADRLQAMLAVAGADYRAEAAANVDRIRSLCAPDAFIAKYLQLTR